MRVLVLTTWFPGEHNPAEAPFNMDHVRALQHAGHEVQVIHVGLGTSAGNRLGDKPASHDWDGVPVQRVPINLTRPLQAAVLQLRLVRQLRASDLLHTMAFSSILAVMFPWLALRILGKEPPWVHTEHWTGALDPASVSPLWKRLARLRAVYRLPHRITGVGSALVQAIEPFARPNAVSVVPCVIRCADAPPNPSFGKPVKLTAVGAVVARKRPEAAIEAVRWLRSRGHAVELTWVGEGPLRSSLERQIAGTELQDYVRFVGAVEPSKVGDFLMNADLFFLPSAHETFFASAAEAIGAGRAVVISRLPGLGDFLNASNSILVDGADPEPLGQGVLQAIARFKGTEAAVIAAPIRERYSVEAVSALFTAVYREAAAEVQ